LTGENDLNRLNPLRTTSGAKGIGHPTLIADEQAGIDELSTAISSKTNDDERVVDITNNTIEQSETDRTWNGETETSQTDLSSKRRRLQSGNPLPYILV